MVEVVIAVGVVSFAFVAILGLIPAGLSQFRQAIDTSVSTQIAQRVIMDAQQTEFDVLTDYSNTKSKPANFSFRAPSVSKPAFRFFDEQGDEIVPGSTSTLTAKEKAAIVYHVNTRVIPTTALPTTIGGNDSPTIATVTVEVAYNPANKTLVPIDPTLTDPSNAQFPFRNLIDLKQPTATGVTVKTYCAVIGRNQ